jgi:hypothetical protein
LGNEKTQALINVKNVQRASNRAAQIKYLEHQIKAAPVDVLDPKPRYTYHMRKVIAKAAVVSSGSKLETNDDMPVPVPHGSNHQSTFLYPRYHLSKIGEIPGEFYTVLYCRIMCTQIRDHQA